LAIRTSIFRKLLLTSILLILVTLASADFWLTRYTEARERSLVQQQMAEELSILAPALTAHPPGNLETWAGEIDSRLHARVTVIDHAGVVMADSRHDPETMENHRARPEVRTALAGGRTSSIRYSKTLGIPFCYYAVPLDRPGNEHAVLRLAVPLTQVGASVAAVRTAILRASFFGAGVALLLAYWLALVFTRRIRRIESYAADLVKADYSRTPAAEGDDELGSVARSLRTMADHFRRMLALLGQESSRREAVLESMVEGVLAVDQKLGITFYNGAFARSVHAPAPAPEGASMLHLVRDPALRDLFSSVMKSGAPASERMSLIGAPGRIFEVQVAPMRDHGAGGALATFHDITELERLERVRKDFVANISHELRTPLAAIQGYTETLLGGALEDPENNRKFLEIIAAHSARITNLASDLLTLSEIETERTGPPTERVSALELARNALELVETQSAERDVRVFLGDAEDLYVAGQKPRLERALCNLLLNGINYNRPGGEVRVDVRSVGDTTRIAVTDTGIGISSQDLPRIFERFYRVDKARSRQTGGTGLGLSIVRNTVERAGGRITVDSQLGVGSVFTMIFPSA
jgi:two-component system phosphate regulon sensor histidine kinase PhoR